MKPETPPLPSEEPSPENCRLTYYLHMASGAWVPQIIWFLRHGPRRFGDLRRDVGNVSPKVLTSKLRKLEQGGLVVRRVLHTSPPQVEYSLSTLGKAFEPVFRALDRMVTKLSRVDKKPPKAD